MNKITPWLISSAVIMLAFPWFAVTFIRGDSGMMTCFFLFYALNPVYAIIVGAYAGKDIKRLWALPVITTVFFLIGAQYGGRYAFILYALIYLLLGLTTMLISALVKKRR